MANANDAGSVDDIDGVLDCVLVTTISKEVPTWPICEELQSQNVELIYNPKVPAIRGVRRSHPYAKLISLPPPLTYRTTSDKAMKVSKQKKPTGHQARLRRHIMRTSGGSSGSRRVTSTVGDTKDASIQVNLNKVEASYATYESAAMCSPDSSVASWRCDETMATSSTASDNVSLDEIDEDAEHEGEGHTRRKEWEHQHAACTACTSSPSPDSVSPLQQLERWSEAWRSFCCLGYLQSRHKDAKEREGDDDTVPVVGLSSQDTDTMMLNDKTADDNVPPGFFEDIDSDPISHDNIVDTAEEEVASYSKKSFQEAVQNGTSSPRHASPSSHASRSSITCRDKKRPKINNSSSSKASKQSKQETQSDARDRCNEIGRICKSVFRIKQDDMPTNFVILPYRMKEDANGQLALASSKDSGLALKFAQSLVKLTNARAILFTLEKKFHERRRCPSGLTSGLNEKETDEISNDLVVFLSLYTANIGYLYLLDERSGAPRIRNVSDSPLTATYPLVITNAYAAVDKLFPLMQMGMTLLRGEVALRVLGEAIVLGSETVSPRRSWICASQEIISFINESSTRPDTHRSEEDDEKSNILRNSLIESTSAMSAKVQKSGLGFEDGSEWAVELSFLKTILEKFDGRTTYAGLKPIRSHGRNIIWTNQMEAGDEAGEVKPPGDYVDPRFRYDAFIHTTINFQEQGSEVSSMTTAYHEEASNASQTQLEDEGIPVVIQTLSAVNEEEPDERTASGEENGSRSEMSSVPLAVSDQESASDAGQAVNRAMRTNTLQEAVTNNDAYSGVTANSDGSSLSDTTTYTAVLETLGFDMYGNAKEDDTIDKSSDSTGDEALAAKESAEHNRTDSVAKYHLELERRDEEESRPSLSLTKENDEKDGSDEGTISDFCAHQVRDSIIEGIDTHQKKHTRNHTIRFVLTAIEEQAAATVAPASSSASGLAILGQEEKQIEKECLCTSDQLLSFIKHAADKEREIQEKDAQIADLKNAIAAFDRMKTAEIHEKDLVIREVARKLRLYPEMRIRSGYDGDDGMPRLNNESEL